MMDANENGLSHELISLCQINEHATHINFYLCYFVLLTKHNICDLDAMCRFWLWMKRKERKNGMYGENSNDFQINSIITAGQTQNHAYKLNETEWNVEF